jgi:hypothetical protein
VAQLAGWRRLFVAAALVLFNRVGWEVLQGYEAELTTASLIFEIVALVPSFGLAPVKVW